jgi:hypothetical protein
LQPETLFDNGFLDLRKVFGLLIVIGDENFGLQR